MIIGSELAFKSMKDLGLQLCSIDSVLQSLYKNVPEDDNDIFQDYFKIKIMIQIKIIAYCQSAA